MFIGRPAVKFCMPFIIGIIAGEKLPISFTVIWVILGVLYTGIIIFLRRNKARNLQTFLIYISLILLGVLKISYDGKFLPDNNISRYVNSNKTVMLKGSVSELPKFTSRSVKFVIDAEVLSVFGREIPVSGGVLISVSDRSIDTVFLDSLTYGKRLCLTGELSPIGSSRNPGDFDVKYYMNVNNVYAKFYPLKLSRTNLTESTKKDFMNLFVFPVRSSVALRIDRFIGGEEAKFLKGLVIGERSEISAEVKSAFINSGVMHILAVSGLHVAILTFIILFFFQLMRVPEKPRIIVTSMLLLYYIFLTGSTASVIRGVIMAIVFLSVKMLGKKGDIYNSLALSAIIILLFDSKQLYHPGFQLSFAAVFSIVYLYPKIFYLPRALKNSRFFTAVFASVSVSAAAGIGTLPFTSVYFGKISLISFVANLVVVPLSNIILALGMLVVAVSYLSGWLASVYAEITIFTTWTLLKLVDFFGNLPLAYINSHFSFYSSILFYTAVGAAINIRQKQKRKKLIIYTLVLINLLTYGFLIFNGKSDYFRVTFLDVGQGDAIFLEFPDGNKMLVDGGPRTIYTDAGARYIGPFLRYKGISRLNTILLTHTHNDHLGGILYLLRNFQVDKVVYADIKCNSSLFQEFLDLTDSLSIPSKYLFAGMIIGEFRDSRIYVLHPSKEFLKRGGEGYRNQNDNSLVLKVCYGKTSILLSGDAEMETEHEITIRYGRFLKSDILKVAHHGSISGTPYSYLYTIRPDAAVISVGSRNKFGHPSPVTLDKILKCGCRCYRTDEEGAVIFESNGKLWTRVDWR